MGRSRGLKKIALLLMAAVPPLLVTLGVSWSYHLLYSPKWVYAVVVDGQTLGLVDDAEQYYQIISKIRARAEGYWDSNLIINEAHSARKELCWYPVIDPISIEARAESAFTYVASGWEILINGKRVVVVDSEDTAKELLESVKNKYISSSANRSIVSVSILDQVSLNKIATSPEIILPGPEALSLLLQGHSGGHTVQRGETMAGIARSYNMVVQDLRKFNPQVSNDWLMAGQKLNIATPLLRVKTVEILKTVESIPPPVRYQSNSSLWYFQSRVVEAGAAGSRKVEYRIELVNGQEEQRVLISKETSREPTLRVIARGTSVWPSRATGMFRWPINPGPGIRLADYFGNFQSWRRSRHMGVDISAPARTDIYAAAAGRVETAEWHSSYGYYVIIDHNNGYKTLYAHAIEKPSVVPGQWVNQGQRIARVGSTGFSTGNHLHFEVRLNGTHIDPLRFFAP